MKIASIAEIKAQFSAFVKASEGGPVVVTRNGKAVAVLLGVQDEDELERLVLSYSTRFRGILDAARQRIRDGAGIGHEDFWREVETARPAKRKTKSRRKTA